MFRKLKILLITAVFLLSIFTAAQAADLSSISYSISGDSSDIDVLELEPTFRLNGGNLAKVNLSFDGDDFYIGTDMGLNMMMTDNFKMDLHLMLTNKVDGHNFGKAIGLAAATRNNNVNFFWRTYYFIDDDLDDHAYYSGGVKFAMAPRSEFIFSFENQYWDLDNDVVKMGINFKL